MCVAGGALESFSARWPCGALLSTRANLAAGLPDGGTRRPRDGAGFCCGCWWRSVPGRHLVPAMVGSGAGPSEACAPARAGIVGGQRERRWITFS